MRYFIKRFKGIIIFAIIEIFFFFKTRPSNLEMFFMVWGFISLTLLLYNIFNVSNNNALRGLGYNDSTNYGNLSGSYLESYYSNNENKKRSGGGLLDSINLLYLFFLVINIIGYIIVMPK